MWCNIKQCGSTIKIVGNSVHTIALERNIMIRYLTQWKAPLRNNISPSSIKFNTRKDVRVAGYENHQYTKFWLPHSLPGHSHKARGQKKNCTATVLHCNNKLWSSNKCVPFVPCLSFNLQSGSFSSSTNPYGGVNQHFP